MDADLKVLVVGGGGREHALCWKIAASPLLAEVLCAPGNAGTAQVARNLPVAADDLDGLVRLAREGRNLAVDVHDVEHVEHLPEQENAYQHQTVAKIQSSVSSQRHMLLIPM